MESHPRPRGLDPEEQVKGTRGGGGIGAHTVPRILNLLLDMAGKALLIWLCGSHALSCTNLLSLLHL